MLCVPLVQVLLKLLVQLIDNRPSKPDVATFIIFDDAELAQGLYKNTLIWSPQRINHILQNDKTVTSQWPTFKIDVYLDLHPVRHLYLTCSELSSYSSLTSFNWGCQTIIRKSLCGFWWSAISNSRVATWSFFMRKSNPKPVKLPIT